MARSAQLAMRGFGGRVRFWGDVLSGVKYRVFEALGALLVLASLLLVLALLTYFPGDASFDTAVAAPPRNYLGYDGAVIADLFMQSVGFAAYLVPAVLLGLRASQDMARSPPRRLAGGCGRTGGRRGGCSRRGQRPPRSKPSSAASPSLRHAAIRASRHCRPGANPSSASCRRSPRRKPRNRRACRGASCALS